MYKIGIFVIRNWLMWLWRLSSLDPGNPNQCPSLKPRRQRKNSFSLSLLFFLLPQGIGEAHPCWGEQFVYTVW